MPSQGFTGAKENQCRDVQPTLDEQFRITEQFLVGPPLDPWVLGLTRPPLPKVRKRFRCKVAERGRAGLRRVVRAGFGKHGAQFVFGNRHKIITRTTQVSPVILPCGAGQTGRNVDDENAFGVMMVFLDGNAMMQAFVQSGFGPARFGKRRSADDIARTTIGYA